MSSGDPSAVRAAGPRAVDQGVRRSGEEGGPSAAPALERRTSRRREQAERVFWNYVDDVWSTTVGSPQRVLTHHTLYLGCAISGALSFAALTCIFPVVMAPHEDRTVWLIIATTLSFVPCVISVMQSLAIWRARKVCAAIVYRFRRYGERIDELMASHARSADLDFARRCSLVQCCYLFACLFFEAFLPPCSRFDAFNVWDYGAQVVPCELWEFFCTWYLVSHVVFVVWVQSLPRVIDRFQICFVPEGRVGLPSEMLDLLHTYSFGDGADHVVDGVDASTCSICIDDFADGEKVRRLPCNHHFHAACLDTWLSTKPMCPMRCHQNLWESVRGLAAEAGMLPPLGASASLPGTPPGMRREGWSPQPTSIGQPTN